MTSDSEDRIDEIEVITRYEKGQPDTYSVDGGKTFMTKAEYQKHSSQSEAPSVEDILHDFAVEESLREVNLSDKLKRKVITADEYDDRLTDGYRKNLEQAKAKINRLIEEAYNKGYSDGRLVKPKYKVGDISGNYRITERFRRVGKNTKYKVVCTLCGAPMFRYSNKFNLRHKDCGALSNNLSKEQLGEK